MNVARIDGTRVLIFDSHGDCVGTISSLTGDRPASAQCEGDEVAVTMTSGRTFIYDNRGNYKGEA